MKVSMVVRDWIGSKMSSPWALHGEILTCSFFETKASRCFFTCLADEDSIFPDYKITIYLTI